MYILILCTHAVPAPELSALRHCSPGYSHIDDVLAPRLSSVAFGDQLDRRRAESCSHIPELDVEPSQGLQEGLID